MAASNKNIEKLKKKEKEKKTLIYSIVKKHEDTRRRVLHPKRRDRETRKNREWNTDSRKAD